MGPCTHTQHRPGRSAKHGLSGCGRDPLARESCGTDVCEVKSSHGHSAWMTGVGPGIQPSFHRLQTNDGGAEMLVPGVLSTLGK